MSNYDEQALVRASLAGDNSAFSELVVRHQDAVYNLAYRLCGNAATAEDMAQEAFIRAYRKRSQYQPSYSFRNWVLGICANLCRSRHRWWHRERKKHEAYASDLIISHQAITHKGGERQADRRDQLALALAALPATLRAAMVLKYMEGMSIQEVAEVLAIKESAVKMRLARGRERLQSLMKNQNHHGE